MAIYGPSDFKISMTDSDNVQGASAIDSSTTLCRANPLRLPGGYILNKSDAEMAIAWGAPAVINAASTLVPAGGAIDIPASFSGDIFGIWPSGATGLAIVHEFVETVASTAQASA
jgi:hypothetical protein